MITGYCRFSWFGVSDTGREISDLETAKSTLWHPERMAVRFHLFEKITLPSIVSQTDQDFKLILLISDEFPDIYRDRLEKAVDGRNNIEISSTAQTDIGRALRQHIEESVDSADKSLHFRIDDDDALSSCYISKLRHIKEQTNLAEGTAISFPKGVVSFLDQDVAKHAPYLKPYIAQGLAFVVGSTYRRNPFQVQHRRVGQRQPSYVDPTFCAFQYTLHGMNNTKGYKADQTERLAQSRSPTRILRNNPNLVAGEVAHPDVEAQIASANFGSSSVTLRASLEETLAPRLLAQSYGFV